MTGARPLFGGIEAGGTKFVLAVGHSPTEILARHALPTRAPEATLRQTEAWFREQGPLAALGIASFGPAVVDRADGSWGHIGTCLLYTSPSPRDGLLSRMPSSA